MNLKSFPLLDNLVLTMALLRVIPTGVKFQMTSQWMNCAVMEVSSTFKNVHMIHRMTVAQMKVLVYGAITMMTLKIVTKPKNLNIKLLNF